MGQISACKMKTNLRCQINGRELEVGGWRQISREKSKEECRSLLLSRI